MKTAIFSIKFEENNFIFDSQQDTTKTIEKIYMKKLKNKYPNFDFNVLVINDEDYNEETQEYGEEILEIRKGKIMHK